MTLTQLPTFCSYNYRKSSSISHISECLGWPHPNPYPQAHTESNLFPLLLHQPLILIFLIASAYLPSPVLISPPSSSEPLSLPSSLTVLLNHVGFFLTQSITLPRRCCWLRPTGNQGFTSFC